MMATNKTVTVTTKKEEEMTKGTLLPSKILERCANWRLKEWLVSWEVTRGSGDLVTHTSMWRGAWRLTQHNDPLFLLRFEQLYAQELSRGDAPLSLFMQEVYHTNMACRVYVDLDSKGSLDITKARLAQIDAVYKTVLREVLDIGGDIGDMLELFVIRNRASPLRKVHMHYPGIVIGDKSVMKEVARRAKRLLPAELAELLDETYSGLRMIGSCKVVDRGEGDKNTRVSDQQSRYLPEGGGVITAVLVRRYSIIPSHGQCVTPLRGSFAYEMQRRKEAKSDEEQCFVERCQEQAAVVSMEALIEAVGMLSESRASKYWPWFCTMRVLRCLRPDDDAEFSELAHLFSAKCTSKYDRDELQQWCDEKLASIDGGGDGNEEDEEEGVWSALLALVKSMMYDAGDVATKAWCKSHSVPWISEKRTLSHMLQELKAKQMVEKKKESVGMEQHSETSIQHIVFNASSRIYLLKAAMGMGKTKVVVRYVQEELSEEATVLCITHRRTLAYELKKRFNFQHYQDMKKGMIKAKRVVCSVESLWRLESVEWDLVIVDEFCSVLSQLTSNKTIKIQPQQVIGTFESILKDGAKRLVGMDAGIEEEDVRFVRKIVGDEEGVVQVVHYTHKPQAGDRFEVTNRKEVWKRSLTKALMAKKRVVVACTSYQESVKISEWIKKSFVSLTVKLYNRDTPESDKRRDFEDLGVALSDIDVLVYTPTLSHGCSYEEERFDVVFGYFPSAGQVDGETCMQMMYRVRNVRERRYVVLTDMGWNTLPETRSGLEEFVKSRSAVQRYGLEDGNLVQRLRGSDEVVYDFKGFYYELYMHVTARKNRSRNRLARRLVKCMLEMGGEVVELGQSTEVDGDGDGDGEEEGEEKGEVDRLVGCMGEIGKELRAKDAALIVVASNITDEQYEEMKERVASGDEQLMLSVDEKRQIQKHRLKSVYELADDDELNVEWVMKNNSPGRMKAFCNLKRLRGCEGDVRAYLAERRRGTRDGSLAETDNDIMMSILHCKGDAAVKETMVNDLVRDLGWKSAVDVDTKVTREELCGRVSALVSWDSKLVTFVNNLFERKSGGGVKKKKSGWTVKNVLEWINPLLDSTYLMRIEACGKTHGRARAYNIKLLYAPP